MNSFSSALAAALLMVTPYAPGAASAQPLPAETAAYDSLLKRYVVPNADGVNRVDYRTWKATAADRKALDAYIDGQSKQKPSAFSKPEQMAYWVNLYNAITLKVILDDYPVKSIRDIKSKGVWLDPKAFLGPWVGKRVTVEGRELSLDNIEHDILRPVYKDPRIHYAVNCASIGCPNLMNRVWTAATLEADLNAAARDFINHPRGAVVGKDGALKVSSIYTWFKSDFGGNDPGVIEHLKRYAGPELAASLKKAAEISGDEYNWQLNETPAAKTGSSG